MVQQQIQEHRKLHVSRRVVPAELDLDEVPVPFTHARVIGLQQELLEALGADDFQDRLCECEHELKDSPTEFRKRHQQLVLEVQAEILPRYGLEGSLRGVADMLEVARDFEDDAEVTANIEAINALIWKPSVSHHGHEHHPCVKAKVHRRSWSQHNGAHHDDAGVARPKAMQPEEDALDIRHAGVELDTDEIPVPATRERALGFLEELRKHFGAHQDDAGVARPKAVQLEEGALDIRHVGVELDMDEILVPFTRERALDLQEELRKHYAADDFQERLRRCEQAHGDGTLEFRREHMRLVLEVQAAILPKWGFAGSLQGVHDMLAAGEAFLTDAEVAANKEALEALIWRSGHAPGVEAMAQKREV